MVTSRLVDVGWRVKLPELAWDGDRPRPRAAGVELTCNSKTRHLPEPISNPYLKNKERLQLSILLL